MILDPRRYGKPLCLVPRENSVTISRMEHHTPAEPKAIRWTRAEYYRMAKAGLLEGRRVELIRGEIVETTPQESLHATGVTLADDAVRRVFRGTFVVRVQLPLSLGLDSDPEPDIAVVAGTPRDYSGAHPSTAVLVVEVAISSVEYDRTTKASIYAEAGVQDYWIVNVPERQLEVYRDPGKVRDEKQRYGYGSSRVLATTDTVSPLGFPDASPRVADFLP
jgi:Uma2 family endonuclease